MTDRASRLRRSLKRLGYDLVGTARGRFHIRHSGSKVNETAGALDLTSVEQWISTRKRKRA